MKKCSIGGGDRGIVVIPGKETLERLQRESIKANYSLMSLTSVIKAQSCCTECWPFPFVWKEQGTFKINANANRKWFCKCAHTHTCKQTFLKRSALLYWDTRPLSWKYWLKKRGTMQSMVLKWDGQRAWLLICILRACPLINIGRRTLVGRGNGQMVHLRNGTPEHRTEYHLLLSDLIPFDQNNCHLHRYHQFCHLHWRQRHSPSHQGFFGFKGGISGSDQMRTISVQKNHSDCPLTVITIFITLMLLTFCSPI